MKRVVLLEYGRFPKREVRPRTLAQLEGFDRRLAKVDGATVLDWSLRNEIRAKSYVGVLQVPGLQVEILPKIDVLSAEQSAPDGDLRLAQRNLLYMLSHAADLPIRDRDLAQVATPNASLLEVLIRMFAERLLSELRRGLPHAYVTREENSAFVKGRIRFPTHVRMNSAHPERTFITYESFDCDTKLNQALRAGCHRMLRATRSSTTTCLLQECLVHLSDVGDVLPTVAELDRIILDRNTQRFGALLVFVRALFRGATPAPEAGDAESFSLLFPMEKVFEAFIGASIRRYADDLGFRRDEIHLQARQNRRWLLRDHAGRGHFRLTPDVLVGSADKTHLIVDTKWKRLLPDALDPRCGVSPADVYQLVAYAERYDCRENVLMFPAVSGAMSKRYRLDGRDEHQPQRWVRVEFVDVGFDLARESGRFREQLRCAVLGEKAHSNSYLRT